MNNNVAQLAADSYFFKELTSGDVQTANQAFGPVVGNEQTQYRVTSKFTTAGEVKAYAICTGQVFIQPHSDTNKINLILRPYRQPMKGVAIKYFIYRGLRKIDFIPSGDTVLVGHSQLPTATGFIQTIWNQLKGFNGWPNTEADANDFLTKWIGYDPANQPDSSLIDDYFFMADAYGDENNETLKPFEFPIISKGTHLGNFIGDYGLDVVLSDGDYKALKSNTGFQFDLAYARAAEVVIDTSQLPTGYAEKQYREAITWFMDAAAYYGLHFSEKGKVFAMNGTNEEKKTGQTLYDDIIAKFATKNNLYLHVQGHLGRSYNYYGSYNKLVDNNEVLKLGIAVDAMNVVPYPVNGWPVIIQKTPQSHSEDTNSIFIQLAYGQNPSLLAFAQVGKLSDAAENNFLTETQLRPEATTDQNGAPVINPYCNPVELIVPAVDDGVDKRNMAGYAKLLYMGSQLTAVEDVNGTLEERLIKPIDTIFGPVNIEQRLASAGEQVISWSFDNTPYLVQKGISTSVVQTKIIADKLAYGNVDDLIVQNRVIYESQLLVALGNVLLERSGKIVPSFSAGIRLFERYGNNFYTLESPLYLETENFIALDQFIKGIRIYSSENVSAVYKYFLGITAEENVQLEEIITTTQSVKGTVFLSEISDAIKKVYSVFSLGVLVEDPMGNIIVRFPADIIKVYSLDGLAFVSKDFTEHMPELTQEIFSNQVIPEV